MRFNQLFKSRTVFTAGALAATGGITFMNKERMPKYLNVSFMNLKPAECESDKISASLTKSVQRNDVAFCREDLAALVREKNCGPILIRLSWHDAGTFEAASGTGGPRACMRFAGGESDHGANAGLSIARDLLSDIKAKYPGISNADFWSLSAVVAIKEMGGPDIPWRAGRSDSSSHQDSVEDGRLPDAT
jgi:catalase (peroxidase I)